MDIAKRVGLHIRVGHSIVAVIEKALLLRLPYFQSFLVVQETSRMVRVSFAEKKRFLELRREHFGDLFCHGSYWINLAGLEYNGYRAFERECLLAKRLEFTHFIVHAGTAKGATNKMQGIDALAISLNKLLKTESDITIVLENTCHGNLAIGSDILDFKHVLEKIDTPERIGFCIDTSHAYAFGYDIISAQAQFIAFLDETVGIERIKLIHLNDTKERSGSMIDRHEVVGEGALGKDVLQRFVMHPQFQAMPLIMELPDISVERESAILENVREW